MPRRLIRGWLVVLALLLAAMTSMPASAVGRPESYDAALAVLRKAVNPQRDNSNLSLISSLRQLRDPALSALFQSLLNSGGNGDWQMEVHAVLGLAEISEQKKLDPEHLKKIDPQGQEHVVAHAIDNDMLSVEDMREILQWQDLEEVARLLLAAELVSLGLGDSIPLDDVRNMASHEDLRVAGIASCVMADVESEGFLSTYRDRLATLGRRPRERYLAIVIEAVRQFGLTNALPLVIDALDHGDPSRNVIYGGLLTCVQLEGDDGLTRWRNHLGDAPSYMQRVRFGMILLASEQEIPTELYDLLPNGEPLLDAMADTGKALSNGTNPAPQLINLMDIGHSRSTSWAMSRTSKLPPEQAAKVYAHVIDGLETTEPVDAGRTALAIDAVEELFDIAPDQVIDRLHAASNNDRVKDALLLGLFRSPSPKVLEGARTVERIGVRRSDSMALILLAKHDADLDDQELRHLGTIAGGGGQVSEVLQAQAAWLYVRRAGETDRALKTLFP